MNRLLRIVVVVSAMVAALGAIASASPAAPRAKATVAGATAPSGITWGACSDPVLIQAHAQCGYLSVPLDYSHPAGPQIQLAVSRIKHTATDYQGVLLSNPGGPGGSGLNLNAFLVGAMQQEGFGAAAAGYDWIGFDPRGVGSSKPALSCDPNYFSPNRPSYIPVTHPLLNFWLAKSNFYAQECGVVSPAQSALLQNMTTRDAALDMDAIRQALGQPQITYYGFSYGTYLGQVYSTLFPSHVRRLIMDSNVDPRRVWYLANLDQDIAFNRNVNIWFRWLAKYNDVYHLGATGADVRTLFYATRDQLASAPAGGQVGPDEWMDIFLLPGYYQQTWLASAQLFANWVHTHDAAAAAALVANYQGGDGVGNDNLFAVYSAVQCTDVQWPLDWAKWSRDNWATYQIAPFETWANAWFNAPCLYWPAPASQPVQINGGGISNALLIDETLDAATPFTGSLYVRKLFPHSVLLAEPGGTTHADSLSGNLCVDGTIARYLATGALPPRKPDSPWDKSCSPLPVPVPSANAGAAPATAPVAAQPSRLGLAAIELH